MNSTGIKVSVIIPALNEEKVIGRCLQSLCRLDFPSADFEVIVVDNGSTDRTMDVARSYADRLKLIVIQKTGVHVSGLRNLGASLARGGILAFLDSDCLVVPDWLSRAVACLSQKDIGVIGAHFLIPKESGWVARTWYGDLQFQKQGDLLWVPSSNTIVSRTLFERVGRFDESIETNEDCEFCSRVRAQGLRIIGDPAMAVVHLESPQTLLGFYRKNCWHATDGLRVFLREFPSLSNGKPIFFGLYTLIGLAGMGWGLVLMVQQRSWNVLVFFMAALMAPSLLLSLRLALRRRNAALFFPLVVLHLVYGIARGRVLLNSKSWRDSRTSPAR